MAKTANQLLADNLSKLMQARGLNNLSLGKAAGLSPNTIKNYLSYDPKQPRSAKGKERSAKLSEVEQIATALGVTLIDLLADREGEAPIPVAVSEPQRQLMLDLDDLAPARQSQLFDMVHQEAESIREAIRHHERKRASPAPTVSSAARREPEHAMVTVPAREEHPKQRTLPLRTVRDPFRAQPTDREVELYRRIGKIPKDPK